MSDSTKKILDMLAGGKITTDEAYRLLSALKSAEEATDTGDKGFVTEKKKPKYLRVTVMPSENTLSGKSEKVNVKVPLTLLRAGIKFTSLIPQNAYEHIEGTLKDKGIQIDIRNIKQEDLEDLIDALADMEVDVEGSEGEKVRVFVE